MKSFKQWLEDADDITGIYPPEYDGVGNYPAGYFTTRTPYLMASRKGTKKKKHKRKKKKSDD